MQNVDREQYEKTLPASWNRQKNLKYIKSLQRNSLPPVVEFEASNVEARTHQDEARLVNESFASVVTDENYPFIEPSRENLYGKSEGNIGEIGLLT